MVCSGNRMGKYNFANSSQTTWQDSTLSSTVFYCMMVLKWLRAHCSTHQLIYSVGFYLFLHNVHHLHENTACVCTLSNDLVSHQYKNDIHSNCSLQLSLDQTSPLFHIREHVSVIQRQLHRCCIYISANVNVPAMLHSNSLPSNRKSDQSICMQNMHLHPTCRQDLGNVHVSPSAAICILYFSINPFAVQVCGNPYTWVAKSSFKLQTLGRQPVPINVTTN